MLQQFREAIPSEHAYRFLICDRDSIFSEEVDRDLKGFGLKILSAHSAGGTNYARVAKSGQKTSLVDSITNIDGRKWRLEF